MLHSRDPKLLLSIALEAADSSSQGDFYAASTSDMIRPKTAGCLQKQMRVNSSTRGRGGVCAAFGSEPATCWSLRKRGRRAFFIRKRCSDFLLWCSCGHGAFACLNEMFLCEAIEGASECVFVQMLLPANNQNEALKPLSRLPGRKKKSERVGFLVLRYS